MARAWVGSSVHKLDKSACTAAILDVLENKESLRAIVQRLSPFEQAGLGLLKLRGQTAPTQEIAMELLMFGLPFVEATRSPYYGYQRETAQYEALNCLLKKGLLLLRVMDTRFSYSQEPSVSEYHNRPIVFADPRILAHVKPVFIVPLSLKPISDVEPGLSKQPAEVMLRFITLMEVIRKIGRIDCTTKGRPTKPYMAKLTKRLGWHHTCDAESAKQLPETLLFFFKLLEGTELIGPLPNGGGRGIHPEAMAFLESSHEAQAAQWIRAYRSLTGWIEYKPESVWFDEDPLEPGKFNSLRAALLTALAALPDPTAWYRIHDLSDGIYGRIGERFSLSYLHSFHQPFQANKTKIDEERRKWQQSLYEQWSKTEHPWLTRALSGPLYHLGLVELASEPGHEKTALTSFRLTGLGRAAMHSLFQEEQVEPSATPTARRQSRKTTALSQETVPCWVVQPNFEVICLSQPLLSIPSRIHRTYRRTPAIRRRNGAVPTDPSHSLFRIGIRHSH